MSCLGESGAGISRRSNARVLMSRIHEVYEPAEPCVATTSAKQHRVQRVDPGEGKRGGCARCPGIRGIFGHAT